MISTLLTVSRDPGGLALDTSGHLYVADGGLEQVDLATNQVTLIPGVAAGASAVAADEHGNVFVSGQTSDVIQRVHTATGTVTTIAGGREGFSGDGGPATEAGLYQPMAVAADNADNIYVGQYWDGRVREVVAGPALRITSAPVSGAVSPTATIGPISVGEEDQFGNPIVAAAGGTTIALASSSPTGFFAATSGGTWTTQLVIPAGASAATFYYGDSSAGSPWLTTSAAGYGTGAQQTTVIGPPTAPLNVQATAGQAQATVAWAQAASDGDSPITSYSVTASPGGATCSQSGPSGGQCTVSGLIDGTTYTFTVTATNAVGTGLPSAPSNAVVPRGVPACRGRCLRQLEMPQGS